MVFLIEMLDSNHDGNISINRKVEIIRKLVLKGGGGVVGVEAWKLRKCDSEITPGRGEPTFLWDCKTSDLQEPA